MAIWDYIKDKVYTWKKGKLLLKVILCTFNYTTWGPNEFLYINFIFLGLILLYVYIQLYCSLQFCILGVNNSSLHSFLIYWPIHKMFFLYLSLFIFWVESVFILKSRYNSLVITMVTLTKYNRRVKVHESQISNKIVKWLWCVCCSLGHMLVVVKSMWLIWASKITNCITYSIQLNALFLKTSRS